MARSGPQPNTVSSRICYFFEDDHTELYDLGHDLSEDADLSAEQPDVTKRLAAVLEEWMRDVQAPVPRPNPNAAFEDLPG